jgi:hypothetical protein
MDLFCQGRLPACRRGFLPCTTLPAGTGLRETGPPRSGPVSKRTVTAALVTGCRAVHRDRRDVIFSRPRPRPHLPRRIRACRRPRLPSRPWRHPRPTPGRRARLAPRRRQRPAPHQRPGPGTACGRCARPGGRCPARRPPGCARHAGARPAPVTRAVSSVSCMRRAHLGCWPTRWHRWPMRSREARWPGISGSKRRAGPRARRPARACCFCCWSSCTTTGHGSGGRRE